MATISLCMIVKNEEEVLENCLNSICKACDEIIIVDTGSTDNTKDIAEKFTNDVFYFEWIDDFSAARNFAFSKATKDFILWLDADDYMDESNLNKLFTLKKELNPSIDAVSMYYQIAFDDYGNPTFQYRRHRLVKRENNFKWHGVVHEYLEVSGNIIQSDIAVIHKKDQKKSSTNSKGRNLRIYKEKLKRGEPFSPRDLYYYANELKDNEEYKKATYYYNEFLATKKGWVEDEINACLNLAKCYSMLGETDEELNSIVKSFKYDLPRPELSCKLGDYFMKKQDYRTALFWFKTAIEITPLDNGGFHQPAFSTWYPHLQLVVCYWHLGDIEKSYEHHKLTASYRPNDPSVLFNNQFFLNDYTRETQDD